MTAGLQKYLCQEGIVQMKNKLAYESPKVSRLDDRDSLLGGLVPIDKCEPGSGETDTCASGNNAGALCDQGADGAAVRDEI